MANRHRHLRNQLLAGVLACMDVAAQTEGDSAAGGAAARRSEQPRPEIERLGGGKFRLGKIDFNQQTREIALDAKVNMNVGYLEYILVNEMMGKVHESLLTTDASPFNLNVVLLLLGYRASSALEQDGEDIAIPPQPGASMDIVVRWKDPEGEPHEPHEAPVEAWVNNLATDAAAARGHWLYTGSKVDGHGGFAAETDGSFIAVYRDHRAVLNNPREGRTSDEIWKPAPQQGLPARETKVRMILRPHPISQPAAVPAPRP